jgi:hypothetical protein
MSNEHEFDFEVENLLLDVVVEIEPPSDARSSRAVGVQRA